MQSALLVSGCRLLATSGKGEQLRIGLLLANFVNYLVLVLTWAIFLRAILSFFVPPGSSNPIMRVLNEVTEPILAPLRRVLPTIGMLDLSPFAAIILLQVIGSLVSRTLVNL